MKDLASSPITDVRQDEPTAQNLTLVLDGITAEDYLQWVREPDPPSLGRELRHIAVRARPFGSRIGLELLWERERPSAHAALATAGFPVNAEVTCVIQDR